MIDKALLEKAARAVLKESTPSCGNERCACYSPRERFECVVGDSPGDLAQAAITTYLAGLWRDISEAPREDGRNIIVGTPERPTGSPHAKLPGYVGEAYWDFEREAFCFNGRWAGHGPQEYANPTHWMPLPALPVPEDRNDES